MNDAEPFRSGCRHVLVFNPGSGSLKFEIVAADPPGSDHVRGRKLISGVVEPVGRDAELKLLDGKKTVSQEEISAEDHGAATDQILALLDGGRFAAAGIPHSGALDLVAHRVVHGGDLYAEPALIRDDVVAAIEKAGELAPLHNAGALAAIRTARAAFGPSIPQVAVFDTAFHRDIPEYARTYAIPWELTSRYGIRRYGFHGISHKYLVLRYAEITGTPLERVNLVTLHLEGGSSATAVHGGRSIDTSMGFTPLEGLVMGTRSGDIDPALLAFLARKEEVKATRVEEWLNKRSGLLGISGRSQDTRVLVQHAEHDPRAQLALDVFSYRVRKYIGAYLAAVGNPGAIVFGGGIGENTPEIRRRICEGLEWFGLDFDRDRNLSTIDCEGQITRDGSRLAVFVIPTEEGLMIAHEAVRYLQGEKVTTMDIERDVNEAPCARCGAEAQWSFLDSSKTRIEILCPNCGRLEMQREEFDQAETENPGNDDPS